MTTPTKVSIISNAFVLLGNQPINDIAVAHPNVRAANNLYDILLLDLLQKTWWQFARETTELSQLLATPPAYLDWQHAYQLPADPASLVLFQIYPKSDYRIYKDTVLSNENSLALDYIYQPPENKFPPHFATALTYALAAGLAVRVTQSFKVEQAMIQLADTKLLAAFGVEGTNEPSQKIEQDPIIETHLRG